MTASDSPSVFADEMIWMAWFMTGSEAASQAILRNITCEGVAETPALSLRQKARLVVVRTFYRVFGDGINEVEADSEDENIRNPLWVLPPAERSVYVLRLIMGQAEPDAAFHLGLPPKAISSILARAAARIAAVFSGPSRHV